MRNENIVHDRIKRSKSGNLLLLFNSENEELFPSHLLSKTLKVKMRERIVL
jgi:hypothetical protein